MVLRIVPEQIARLEREIDAMNEELEPLRSFILPAGEAGAAHLHLARDRAAGRARRGGRRSGGFLNPLALAYINRLSDHLFVAARLAAKQEGGEILWQPGATRGP